MSDLLQANKLTRFYGDYRAVDNVSITLRAGDILGLLGPNGAGKTTTMGMLTGNLSPSHGNVLIKGCDLADEPRQAKQSVGYLPEQPPLYRDLTVNEYLRYTARLRNLRGQAISPAVNKACERSGLTEVTQRLIGNLSKGFQQRVGIAQAIIHEPDVIILDEPTVGLDPIQIREIRELIRELGTKHSVILSTHILPEVQAVCNRVNIMHLGRIVYDDTDSETPEYQQLIVQFNKDIDVNVLLQLSSVSNVIRQETGRYVIQHQSASNPANTIATMAIENQWGLSELTPSIMGLEHIFVSLTQGEHAEDAQAQAEGEAA
jgi:ABC-2 type transport system ATP-binding protein